MILSKETLLQENEQKQIRPKYWQVNFKFVDMGRITFLLQRYKEVSSEDSVSITIICSTLLSLEGYRFYSRETQLLKCHEPQLLPPS